MLPRVHEFSAPSVGCAKVPDFGSQAGMRRNGKGISGGVSDKTDGICYTQRPKRNFPLWYIHPRKKKEAGLEYGNLARSGASINTF